MSKSGRSAPRWAAVRRAVLTAAWAVLAVVPGLGAQEPPPIAAGRAAPAGTYGDLDVLHYDLEIGLPAPGGDEIEGIARLRLTPAREGVTDALLDFTGLRVRAVTLDGAAVEAAHRDGRLGVPLPPGAGPADTFALEIVYSGVPDDGLVLGRNVHGRPSVFADNWPNRARFWFPAVDHPSDKATASFTVHAPASWVVVANGARVGEPSQGPPAEGGAPRRTWRWETDVSVSAYNLVIGSAEMQVMDLGTAACGSAPASPREDGCVEVSAWLLREDTAQARRSFARAAEMVDYYTRLVGPYPFEKLAHVQSATRFGGMENASAIFYSDEGIASGRDLEGTVAHETAHQWFGDDVTESDWAELWLSEGFATYFGHLFFEHADGSEEFRRRMEESRQDYLSSNVTGQPVIERGAQDLFRLLNANNYPKGGWVLHMLRGLVGDSAFFAGIRGYYARYTGGNATTEDFRRVMESVSGRELRWFFEQWLERPGYPVLDTEWAWDASREEVVVTVTQTQDRSWPLFRLPVAIELSADGGGGARHAVELVGQVQRFRFPAATEPTEVTLDPDGWVLKGPGRTRKVEVPRTGG